MRKMIPTDFVLTLPRNILGHSDRCTCIKSHYQSRVRGECLIPVKMAENLVGYARTPGLTYGTRIPLSMAV